MKIKICVIIPIKKISKLISKIKKAEEANANIIEIRLDYFDDGVLNNIDEMEEIIKQTNIPLIATNRLYTQGGFRPQNEDRRIKTLIKAAELGFQYVDVELTTLKLKSTIKKVKDFGAKVIVSDHNFVITPSVSEMKKTVRNQIEVGSDVCKIVTMAKAVSDNVQCMLTANHMSKLTKIVCFAMGNLGLTSRVLSPLFGSYLTYATLENNFKTAPGQISIGELKKIYNRLGVN